MRYVGIINRLSTVIHFTFKIIFLAYFHMTLAHATTNVFSRITFQAHQTIQQLYHNHNSKPISSLAQRVSFISAQFLGKSYETCPLGEGLHDDYDQFPLYRMDAFDCVTFVETVLALSLADNPQEFKQYIKRIRYKNGHVSFIDRNHFPDLDWNQNNQRQGILKDITRTIKNKDHKPVFKIAKAYIDKKAWYQYFSLEKIRLRKEDPIEQKKKLIQLKQLGQELQGQVSYLPYIPLSVLFDKKGQENLFLFNQIPQAAIIEIVRPNWDVEQKIGTRMNVSHLGFAIWKNHTLYFRASSSVFHRVTDIPLVEYLRNTLKSPTIRGINVQIILPKSNHKNVPQVKT